MSTHRCAACNDSDPLCLLVTCEERARATFRRLTENEIRKRQDLCSQQLARASEQNVIRRLAFMERLLADEMLRRLPA